MKTPRAGRLRKIVSFQVRDTTADAYGNATDDTWSESFKTRGELTETGGRERIMAGALQAPASGVLRVRSTSLTRAMTTANSVVIDDVRWNVRSLVNPDQRNRFLEMIVERDVG